jgi:hypothetical protein
MGGGASGVASEAEAGAGVMDDADGTAIPRILERIRERRSAFTLAAISSSVSPIVEWIMGESEFGKESSPIWQQLPSPVVLQRIVEVRVKRSDDGDGD